MAGLPIRMLLEAGIAAATPAVQKWLVEQAASTEKIDLKQVAQTIKTVAAEVAQEIGPLALRLATARSADTVFSACHDLQGIIHKLSPAALAKLERKNGLDLIDQLVRWQLVRVVKLQLSKAKIEQATSHKNAQTMMVQALWLLARCDGEVPDSDYQRITETLSTLFRLENRKLAESLKAVSASNSILVYDQLRMTDCCKSLATECIGADLIAVYVVKALRGSMKPKHQQSLLADITTWFPE